MPSMALKRLWNTLACRLVCDRERNNLQWPSRAHTHWPWQDGNTDVEASVQSHQLRFWNIYTCFKNILGQCKLTLLPPLWWRVSFHEIYFIWYSPLLDYPYWMCPIYQSLSKAILPISTSSKNCPCIIMLGRTLIPNYCDLPLNIIWQTDVSAG